MHKEPTIKPQTDKRREVIKHPKRKIMMSNWQTTVPHRHISIKTHYHALKTLVLQDFMCHNCETVSFAIN